MKVDDFLRDYIETWEGSKKRGYLSLDPDDNGNYFKGALIGSNYGVTGPVLAAYRGVKSLSASDMKNLTLGEAVAIARKLYFDEPNFDLLPWNPAVASAVDMGWGAGPVAAVKILQRVVGVPADGRIGPVTVAAVARAAERDLTALANEYVAGRYVYYEKVIAAQPVKAKYRKGWRNRTNYFAPGGAWWRKWPFDTPVQPAEPVLELSPEIAITASLNRKSLEKAIAQQATAVLAGAPASLAEKVVTAVKIKATEKSTVIGTALVVGTVLMDPTVQAGIGGVVSAAKHGGLGGILASLIGLGMIVYRQRSSPKVDEAIAAKRIEAG